MSSTADLTHEGYEPWSPDMVRDQSFPAPTKRARAYDADEVDAFTARMGDEIEWLHARIRAMSAQAPPIVFEVNETGELSVYDTVDEQAVQIRMRAQDDADRIVAEAEQMADDIVAEAQHHADDIELARSDEPDAPEAEPDPYVIANTLPARIKEWEAGGERIVYDAKRLLQVAQDALSRVAQSHERVSQALVSGERSEQQGAAQPNPTTDLTG